eukprot:1138036-Pelagomonas_calceolata.AAC.4
MQQMILLAKDNMEQEKGEHESYVGSENAPYFGPVKHVLQGLLCTIQGAQPCSPLSRVICLHAACPSADQGAWPCLHTPAASAAVEPAASKTQSGSKPEAPSCTGGVPDLAACSPKL